LQDRQADVDPDLGDPARLQELVGREPGAGGLQAEAGERVEDDFGGGEHHARVMVSLVRQPI
jgi:hypothetical protein